MRLFLAISAFGLMMSAGALAQDTGVADEFSIISRDTKGTFLGSHKIFKRPAKGMKKVSYCDQDYWVRPYTVAWTQTEVENRRIVRVEYSTGRGWRPICANPQRQVTLEDIGIKQDASDIIYFGGLKSPSQGQTIFDSMKRSLSTDKPEDKASGSYHAK